MASPSIWQDYVDVKHTRKLEHKWLDPIVLKLSPCSCLRSCSCSSWLRRGQSQAARLAGDLPGLPSALFSSLAAKSLEEARVVVRPWLHGSPEEQQFGTCDDQRIADQAKWPLRTSGGQLGKLAGRASLSQVGCICLQMRCMSTRRAQLPRRPKLEKGDTMRRRSLEEDRCWASASAPCLVPAPTMPGEPLQRRAQGRVGVAKQGEAEAKPRRSRGEGHVVGSRCRSTAAGDKRARPRISVLHFTTSELRGSGPFWPKDHLAAGRLSG